MTTATPRAPGLHLRGSETRVRPGRQTAVTGFVGIAERGPIHVPQPLEGWGEYLRVFGGFVEYGSLADAVFGFFANGGESSWVVRVADTGDRSAENALGTCRRVELLARARTGSPVVDAGGAETLRIEAIDEGSWGNGLSCELVAPGTQLPGPADTMRLAALTADAGGGQPVVRVDSVVDFSVGMPVFLGHASDPFRREQGRVQSIDPLQRTLTLEEDLAADYPAGSAVLGAGFRLIATLGAQREAFEGLSINASHPRYVLAVVNGRDDAPRSYVERERRGHSILVRVAHVLDPLTGASRGKPASAVYDRFEGGGSGRTFARATLTAAGGASSLRVFASAAFPGRRGNALTVEASDFATEMVLDVPVPGLAAPEADDVVVERADGFVAGQPVELVHAADSTVTETATLVQVTPGNALRLSPVPGQPFPRGSRARVPGRFDLAVNRDGEREPVAVFRNLSSDPGDGAHFAPLALPAGSPVCVDDLGAAVQPPSGPTPLAGGADPGDLPVSFYTGYGADGGAFVAPGTAPGTKVGLAALEDVSDVDLVAIPDLWRALDVRAETPAHLTGQRHLLSHCRRAGDRFALLDARPAATPSEVAGWTPRLADTVLGAYGAFYYPWVRCKLGDAFRFVPPCGVVAGLIARVDRTAGVDVAPAQRELRDVVELERRIERAEEAKLVPLGVNTLRGAGGQIVVHGARTLAPEPRYRYVNARRVVLSLVKELRVKLLWTTFEPAGPALWRQLEDSVRSVLEAFFARGATSGERPEDSYFVRCDAETTTAEDEAAGRVVAEVGIAPGAPAEFVLLTARRSPESVSIFEAEA